MRIQVHGKNIDVGDALRAHATGALEVMVAKYAIRPVESVATFSREGRGFDCDASLHLSTGMKAQATAHNADVYAAFDDCLARMEKQLRRYKRRLKNHHQKREGREIPKFDAAYSVLTSSDEGAEDSTGDSLQPVIVAETRMTIQLLSVGEAVMQMEIADAPALVFRNESTETINVVYRRKDGNIGWIDPRQAESE